MSNLLQKKQLVQTKHESNRPARSFALLLAILVCLTVSATAAQTTPASPAPVPGFDSLAHPPAVITPLTQPTLSPGVVLLMELDGRFAQAVASGGGKAFAAWFADDAVTLNNGRPAVFGRAAIAAQAKWDPKTYQLTWVPQGAQMGPSNDMGFTWGHYEGRSIDKNGQPVVTSGRYITMWKKLSDGSWKVAMDASADDAAPSECCTLPKP
jgi:ketosteroid isomerase-like protein